MSLAHREHVELEVTVLPDLEDQVWQMARSKLAWRDAKGEHELGPKPQPWPGSSKD